MVRIIVDERHTAELAAHGQRYLGYFLAVVPDDDALADRASLDDPRGPVGRLGEAERHCFEREPRRDRADAGVVGPDDCDPAGLHVAEEREEGFTDLVLVAVVV